MDDVQEKPAGQGPQPGARGGFGAVLDSKKRWMAADERLHVGEDADLGESQQAQAQARRVLEAEHSLLLNEVQTRADAVLAAAATGQWPLCELTDLVDYLRSELISQTRVEDHLLMVQASTSAREAFGRLTRDHARLRYAVEILADATAVDGGGDSNALCAQVRGINSQLASHLAYEREVLAEYATNDGWRQMMTALERQPHAWFTLMHGPIIDLSSLSPAQIVDAMTRRVQQLAPGEGVEVTCSTDPEHLCVRLLRDREIAVEYIDAGPESWRLKIWRRHADH